MINELSILNNCTLGEKVKWLRENKTVDSSKKGYMSTKKLADELNISPATLSGLENTKDCNLSTIFAVADYFNVSIDWLCSRSTVSDVNYDLDFICNQTGLSETAINHITSPPIINTLIVNNLINGIQIPDLMMLFDKKHSDVKAKVFESTEFYELISLLSYRAVKSELYALSVNQLLNDLQGNSYRLTKSETAQINASLSAINILGNEIKALTLDIEQKYQKFFNDITENASSDINKFADMLNDEISKIEVIDNE